MKRVRFLFVITTVSIWIVVTNGFLSLLQGMQALLDLICAVEGSVADAAKKLGYLIFDSKPLVHLYFPS